MTETVIRTFLLVTSDGASVQVEKRSRHERDSSRYISISHSGIPIAGFDDQRSHDASGFLGSLLGILSKNR